MFFLIGHRGVGKTSLALELENSCDLDAEISKSHEIDSYFLNNDEKGFRDLEREHLQKIISEKQFKVVSLGAGFELDKFNFPVGSIFIWVQRRSDKFGRVFLNRPRLNKKESPLDEFFTRYPERQKMYSSQADLMFELQEGAPISQSVAMLKNIVSGEKIHSKHAYYTIQSEADLRFVSGCVELRSDLLTADSVLSILNKYRENEYIYAVRTKVSVDFLDKVAAYKNCSIDLPLEDKVFLKSFTSERCLKSVFVSYHEPLEPEDLAYVQSKGFHLKWAPLISNFKELGAALDLIKDSDVSFLPRDSAASAKWQWVREALFSKNKINFYRTGLTDYLDQVSAYNLDSLEAGLELTSSKNYAAVLGENVYLSRSPGFHKLFFQKEFKSIYSSISFERDEFNKENLSLLQSLGFTSFSVTAPFKDKMSFLGSGKSVNTVGVSGSELVFADTDSAALKSLVSSLKSDQKVLIWGAGSMGQALKRILGAAADLISVRDYQGERLKAYQVLIWCAGATDQLPQFEVIPEKILDLEYKEHSKAIQVAISLGTQYTSGEEMFKHQAIAQQAFWLKLSKEKS